MKPGVKAGNKTLCGSLSHSKKLINLRFGTKTVFGVFQNLKKHIPFYDCSTFCACLLSYNSFLSNDCKHKY